MRRRTRCAFALGTALSGRSSYDTKEAVRFTRSSFRRSACASRQAMRLPVDPGRESSERLDLLRTGEAVRDYVGQETTRLSSLGDDKVWRLGE